jgi:hypothetical protein
MHSVVSLKMVDWLLVPTVALLRFGRTFSDADALAFACAVALLRRRRLRTLRQKAKETRVGKRGAAQRAEFSSPTARSRADLPSDLAPVHQLQRQEAHLHCVRVTLRP